MSRSRPPQVTPRPKFVELAGRRLMLSRKAEMLAGRPADHPALAKLHAELGGRLPRPRGRRGGDRLGDEGYLLAVEPAGVRIVAGGPAGAFYAAQTLEQLRGDDGSLPAVRIADAPAFPVRGLHIGYHRLADLAKIERAVAEVFPRLKANLLVLSVGCNFKFASHPEVKGRVRMTAAQARRLVKVARANHVRVVPLFNCLGHQSWGTKNVGGLLAAYPEFNETPGRQGIHPAGYAWCPSNPKVLSVVRDLLDELIDAFEPDALHLGMDEVFQLGQCPRCRGKGPAELFARAVNDLHAHVVGRRGLGMYLWGDRLVDGRKTPYNANNGSRGGTWPARRMIRRDIVLCDWHYHLHRRYPSIGQFERAGFNYLLSPWWKPDAWVAFSRYADAHAGQGLAGFLQTSWTDPAPVLDGLLGADISGLERAHVYQSVARNFYVGCEWAWRGRQELTARRTLRREMVVA